MKIETKKIQAAMFALRPIFKGCQSLPILSCVKLHTESNRLHIAASNLDEFQVERVECDGEISPVCVSFNQLSLSLAGETAEIVADKTTLTITCGLDETVLSTLDAEEFPPLPKFENSQTHGVPCGDLAAAIKQVLFAASVDISRYVLQSVLIESTAKKTTAIATNGRELAIVELPVLSSKFEAIPASAFCGNLVNALTREGAAFASNDSKVKVTHDSGVYFAKQIEGKYPNWAQVLPKKTTKLGVVDVKPLADILSAVMGFDNKTDARGICTFSKDGLLIEFVGESGSKLTRHIGGSFPDFKIAMSLRKLLLIFQNLETEKATLLHSGDELSPIIVESGDLRVISMPMRMN